MKYLSYILAALLPLMMVCSCDKEENTPAPPDYTDEIDHGPFPSATEREAVDFGLASKTLWATTNVGICTEAPYGQYYNWGRIVPQWEMEKNGLIWAGDIDDSNDVATRAWGKEWSIPTEMDFYELYNSSKVTWTWKPAGESGYGVPGYEVKGTGAYADSKIFLPAAGHSVSGRLTLRAEAGCYWTRSIDKDDEEKAICFYFNAKTVEKQLRTAQGEPRYYGCCIRPIKRYVEKKD